MLPVSKIMTRDVISVSPDLGLRDAMELFVKEHVSGAPVVEGRKVIGVVSMTDLLGLAASTPDASAIRGRSILSDHETDSAGHEAGDEPPASFFSELWDDADDEVSLRSTIPELSQWNTLDPRTVRDAMSSEVLHLPEDAEVVQAAAFLQKHGIRRALIMEGDALVGIVTTSDISRAVSENRLSQRRFVFGSPHNREDGSWW